METVRTLVLAALLVIAVAVFASLTAVWLDARSVISKAEATIFRPQSDAPLSMVERAVVAAEFENSWDVRAKTCRQVAQLWPDQTRTGPARMGDAPVSGALATMLLMQAMPERSLRWQLTRVMTACQLEQRYADRELLRAWLSQAYFGDGMAGVEQASTKLFGKPASELGLAESSKLAALLRAPNAYRDAPHRWQARAQIIEERVEHSSR